MPLRRLGKNNLHIVGARACIVSSELHVTYAILYPAFAASVMHTARLKTSSVDMIPVCQPCNVSDTALINRGFQVKAINGTRLALHYRNAQPPLPEDPMLRQCVCMPYEGQRCMFAARFGVLTCGHCYLWARPLEGNLNVEVECHCGCFICDPTSESEEPPPRERSRSRSR